MFRLLEKSFAYLIGGIVGIIVGVILIQFEISFLCEEDRPIIIIITGLLGIIVGNIIHEHRQEKEFSKNTKIRDETVALITHEMKTGLTSTGWAIQTILQQYGPKIHEDDKKMLEDVLKSIRGTVMHSVNLLDVSLLDIGKLAISLKKESLGNVEEMFNQTVSRYTFGAEQKWINLISDIRLDHQKEVEVDMLRIRIILENLLENALQYTADIIGRKKEIHVKITNDENKMYISVTDSGIGIPEHEKSKIFDQFFRASNARSKLVSGSGIGLSMAKEYVKAHKGEITFDSKENEGTVFNVSIPLKTAVDTEEFLKEI